MEEARETAPDSASEASDGNLFPRLGYAKRDVALLLAISLVVAACGVLGASYVLGQGQSSLDAPLAAVLIAAVTVLAAVALVAVDVGLFRLAAYRSARELGSPSWLARLTPAWTTKSIALFSLVMILLWVPWMVANFPGGTYWDTYYQIFQCYPENHPIAIIPYEECYDNTLTDAYLCDHHPIVVTLIYGAFGMVSDALTGNWMIGVFAFTFLQGALSVLAFTAAVAYLRECGCPLSLCFAAYAFFCVMPFISTWAMCMVKDSMFGALYVPYFIMLFEAARTRGRSLTRPRSVALFIVLGVVLCLTKKQGLYVVVPTALVAAFLYRARSREKSAQSGGKAFLAQALLCVIVMQLFMPYVVFPLVNVAPGGKQEVLGPLFQQTAHYVTYHSEDVTEDERAAIDKVLEYDNLAEQHTFDFQDEVKYRFRLDATNDDVANYIKVWAAQGLRHPESYVAALMSIAGFYVAPCGDINIRMVTVDTHMGDDNRYMLYNPDELDGMRLGMERAYNMVAKMPGIDVPLLSVTYVFWLPAALLFVVLRRRLRCGVLFVPTAVLLAFCVIAPVYDARYCVPLLYAAPLLLCMVAGLMRSRYGLSGERASCATMAGDKEECAAAHIRGRGKEEQ